MRRLLVCVVLLGACGKGSKSAPSFPPGRVQATACPHERAPGSAEADMEGGQCHSDAECTAGQNGRCMIAGSRVRTTQCTYDTCFSDADCKTGGPCECDANGGNHCLPGNCKVDADCGPHGSCDRSNNVDCGSFDISYWCHTSKDTCTSDDSCNTHKEGQRYRRCLYQREIGHWGCVEEPLCDVG